MTTTITVLLTLLVIGLTWRGSYWRNQWNDLSATHARTLDQLAATKEAMRTLPPPIERPRTKHPADLTLMEKIWWDLAEYERTGWWDERIAWRIHPDDAELVSTQLHTWRETRGDNRPPPLGLHIMGTPLLVDPGVARYDAVGTRPDAHVLHLHEKEAPGLVPPRGTRFARAATARQPVSGVQAGGGLRSSGPAPAGGSGEGGPRIDSAPVD